MAKNNKSIYVVCSKKSNIPIKEGWTPRVYTSKREALYMGCNNEKTIIEYIPKKVIYNFKRRKKA